MPGDTGTGSNFKGMLVFDLAILQNTALLELAHDSLLFKGNGYDLEECPIFVGEEETDLEPVYKPNKSRFRSDRNKKTVDEISSMEYFDVTVDGEL